MYFNSTAKFSLWWPVPPLAALDLGRDAREERRERRREKKIKREEEKKRRREEERREEKEEKKKREREKRKREREGERTERKSAGEIRMVGDLATQRCGDSTLTM